MHEIIQAEKEFFQKQIPSYQRCWQGGHHLACILYVPVTVFWAVVLVVGWPVCKIHNLFCK